MNECRTCERAYNVDDVRKPCHRYPRCSGREHAPMLDRARTLTCPVCHTGHAIQLLEAGPEVFTGRCHYTGRKIELRAL